MRAADLHRLARILREVALRATSDSDDERVSPGELAIVEDVAIHATSTVGEVAERTRLAQSLVSRIATRMRAAGVFTIGVDERDHRKTVLSIDPSARSGLLRARGQNMIDAAINDCLPRLSATEQASLIAHLASAINLIDKGRRP